jgi:hypothetical protein
VNLAGNYAFDPTRAVPALTCVFVRSSRCYQRHNRMKLVGNAWRPSWRASSSMSTSWRSSLICSSHEGPAHIRSDTGAEIITTAVQVWLTQIGVKTLYIAPRPTWENCYNESFNGSLRDELLNSKIFYNLAEAKVLIEAWRRHYNTVRPHSSLGYRPPAPQAATPPLPAFRFRLAPPAAGDGGGDDDALTIYRTTRWGLLKQTRNHQQGPC